MQIPTLACDICKCRIQVQDSLLATSGLAISGEGFEWVINRDNRWELVPAERPAEARTHICHGCLDGLAEYFSKRDDKPAATSGSERLSSPTHPSQEEHMDRSAYQQRDRLLASMGFPSYKAYLATPLWRSIRAAVLMRDGHLCHCCRRPANQVHHTRYDLATLKGEVLTGLESICKGCHRAAEFSKHGKASLRYANRRMKRIRSNKAKSKAWESSPAYRTLLGHKRRILASDKGPERTIALAEVRAKIRAIVREHQGGTDCPPITASQPQPVLGAPLRESANKRGQSALTGRPQPIPAQITR